MPSRHDGFEEALHKYNNPDDREIYERYVLFFQQSRMIYDAAIAAGFTVREAMELLINLMNQSVSGKGSTSEKGR